jgi:hypothetical protein
VAAVNAHADSPRILAVALLIVIVAGMAVLVYGLPPNGFGGPLIAFGAINILLHRRIG